MIHNKINIFFKIFDEEFRKNKLIAYETLMLLSIAHYFGYYNPKHYCPKYLSNKINWLSEFEP